MILGLLILAFAAGYALGIYVTLHKDYWFNE